MGFVHQTGPYFKAGSETQHLLPPDTIQILLQESNAVEPVFSKLTPQDIAAVAAKVLDNAKHREIVEKAIDPEKKQWEK